MNDEEGDDDIESMDLEELHFGSVNNQSEDSHSAGGGGGGNNQGGL